MTIQPDEIVITGRTRTSFARPTICHSCRRARFRQQQVKTPPNQRRIYPCELHGSAFVLHSRMYLLVKSNVGRLPSFLPWLPCEGNLAVMRGERASARTGRTHTHTRSLLHSFTCLSLRSVGAHGNEFLSGEIYVCERVTRPRLHDDKG